MFEKTGQPRLFGLPAGVDFPGEVAAGLVARLARHPPEVRARVTVYLNSSRMRERVQAALMSHGAGLLPRLRVLTDVGADPAFDMPPAVPEVRRRLEMSAPVSRLLALEKRLQPGTTVYDLADSLARLSDEMQDEGVAPGAFEATGIADNHAAHWEASLRFLRIITPWLGTGTLPDGATRQRRAVEAMVDGWCKDPPRDPVIVAGSTGSRGTTLLLLKAVAQLPQGAVILPGFDFDMPDFAWNSLLSGPVPAEDHPQYRHANVMAELGLGPGGVRRWTDRPQHDPARGRLVSLALRPAPVTDQWLTEGTSLGSLEPATRNMTLIEAADPRTEAQAIAAVLRKAAEDGRRAALVSPDQALVRRVTAALDRWRIVPDSSSGEPLPLTAPGRFLGQIAALFGRQLTIESLLALLKHPITATGADLRGPHLLLTRELELHLRRHGPPFPGGSDLQRWAAGRRNREADPWVGWLAPLIGSIPDGSDRPILAWIDTFLDLAGRIAAGPGGSVEASGLWREEAGAAAAGVLKTLKAEAPWGGPVDAAGFSNLLARQLEPERVRQTVAAHPLVVFRGTREARELDADLVILAGLNEGSWPEAPPPDPWLSRQMRLQIGLALPERQIGLSAHDFQQAIAAPEVIISRAVRDDEAETVASRWLDRLTNLVSGLPGGDGALAAMRERGRGWVRLAAAAEAPLPAPPAPRPAPRPPADARPRELPVTAIRTLIRNPYDIYAKYVLRLHPLDPLFPEADARLRGQALHRIVEDFVRHRPEDETPEAATARLLAVAETVLLDEVAWPSARRLWLARIRRFAGWLVTTEEARSECGAPVVLETGGGVNLTSHPFRLTARPDRIDLLADGTLQIFDYKSGAPPSAAAQKAFEKQLPLEAAMAERGAFAEVGPLPVSAATYIRLGGEGQERSQDRAALDPDGHWAGLERLVGHFLDAAAPFPARRAMFSEKDTSDYDHLARFGEWEASDTPEPEDVGR